MCYAFKVTISDLLKMETVERLNIMAEYLPQVEDEWFRRQQLAAQGSYPTENRKPTVETDTSVDPEFFSDLEDFRLRRRMIEERKRERQR